MDAKIEDLEEAILNRSSKIEYMLDQEYSSDLILTEESYLAKQQEQLEDLYWGHP